MFLPVGAIRIQITLLLLLALFFVGVGTALAGVPEVCKKLVTDPPTKPSCDLNDARSCSWGEPLVAAAYHYFYGPSDKDATVGFSDTPYTFNKFGLKEWHQKQLSYMKQSRIDIAVIDFRGSPVAKGGWITNDLNTLVEARSKLDCKGKKPPLFAMGYNTISLDFDRNIQTLNGVNLRTDSGRGFFYETIARFFCRVPSHSWAKIDDKVLVFVDTFLYAGAVDTDLFPTISSVFKQDFGHEIFFVKSRDNFDYTSSQDPDIQVLSTGVLNGGISRGSLREKILSSNKFFLLSGGTSEGFLQQFYRKVYLSEMPSVGPALSSDDFEEKEARERFVAEQFAGEGRDALNRTIVSRWFKHLTDHHTPVGILKTQMAENNFPIPELRQWTQMLNEGISENIILAEIIASQWFFEKSGQSSEIFIRRIYEKLLFKCPTVEELSPWMQFVKDREGTSKTLTRNIRRALAMRFLSSGQAGLKAIVAFNFAYYFDRVPGWPGFADASYSSRGARCAEYASVASIGPGYNDTNIAGSLPTVVSREEGQYYRNSWEKLLEMEPRPPMVYIESWNNYHRGTELTKTKEYLSHYIDSTRNFVEKYNSGFSSGSKSCP